MSTVAVGRLRNIAKTVRQLPTFYRVPGSIAGHYFLIVDKGAAYIRKAERLGAFQGDSIYGRIGEKLAHPSCHLDDMITIAARKVPGWKLTVWYAVVDTLAPELIRKRSRSRDTNGDYSMRFDTSEAEAEIVARAIEAEADRIEAQSKADKRSVRNKNQETRIPVCQSKAVKLFGPGEQPQVNGKRKPILTPARYDAVQALIEAGETGLTKDQLDNKSRHSDARKLLKALAKDDADWARAIRFPGTSGKRYRIR